MIPRVLATRYVAPLREGGSLPGLVEAEDLGTYVMKFRGAGQGVKALVAEVIVGELGRRIGLRVPEMRALELDAEIGRYEKDEEVQDLLTSSIGLNLGIDFLPGSFGYDGVAFKPPAEEAARILWLDAFTANIDRTWRNPNLLVWHRNLWCIDHGAALYFHHNWESTSPEKFAASTIFQPSEHILLGVGRSAAPAADRELSATVDRPLLEEVVEEVPPGWMDAPAERYVEFLTARLKSRSWRPPW